MSKRLPWAAAAFAVASASALVSYRFAQQPVIVPSRPPSVRRAVLQVTPPVPELPPSEPSAETPILSEAARANIERGEHALATELSKMWTRNPGELVAVIDEAARSAAASPSVTLLLAIAHAETNGRILDVSEAGAVGLAQATPVAIRQEDMFDGKMFVTPDYLVGSRAYIMKKPLGDADTIATMVLAHDNARTRAKARRLLTAAQELRREGVDELQLLELYASPVYRERIDAADEHNRDVLRQLGHLLESGNRTRLRAFRDRTRREYRALKQTQVASWARYQHDLIGERDRMLAKRFGMPSATVRRLHPYDAGEYLGEALDIRFSAKKMAAFLVRHLERKSLEARALTGSNGNVEMMTAALYNGGAHNVKRMLVGLIASLPETQRYMRKVPATRRRLDRSVQIAGATLDTSHERALR